MDDPQQLKYLYKSFRKLTDEAGSFFRQKDNYSLSERISYLIALYKAYVAIELFFDNSDDLQNGKSVLISTNGDFSKVLLDKKHLRDEFETTISVVYFNLSKQEILEMIGSCKANSMLQQKLVLERMFEKFLA